jgi:hypothetical protein
MRMKRDPKLDAFIRDQGVEFEAALREAGSPLRPGVTGQDFIESALADGEQRAKSPEGQALFRRMQKVIEEVAAELPGGVDDPNFMACLEARSKDLFGDGGAGASA